MDVSRRTFLGSLGATAATAAVLHFPLRGDLAFAGEPKRITARGGAILLNSNENAYGTFPSVHAAMAGALGICNRYPDNEWDALIEQLAALHKVSPEQIVLGNGSGDILRMAAEAFCSRAETLVTAAPTFELLSYYVGRRDARVIQVPLRPDFAHDLDAMLLKARQGPSLIYLCNPNNPTASITPRHDIDALIAKLPADAYLLIDEAYHHFADSPDYVSFLDRPVDDRRVIVARTFSKIYGLAGLRLGYAVAAAETIERMARFRVQDSPNGLAARAAMAALADTAALSAGIRRNATDRAEFMKQAQARMLSVIPSQANFVMMETGRPVRSVIAHFQEHNVLVGRPFPPMESYLRVSLGTPEQMTRFWKVWDKLPGPARQ